MLDGWSEIAGFDPEAEGLVRLKRSHSEIPGCDVSWDTRPVGPKWQRIPGCIRVVSAKIVDPVPYEAPAWAGWRGVVTKVGLVFDYEAGHRMKDYSSTLRGGGFTPNDGSTARQRKPKEKK